MSNSRGEKLEKLFLKIRNIGLIIGVPTLIVVGIYLYNRQIEIYKAEIELLQQTQYDKALSIIESQKKLFEIERKKLENEIRELENHKNTALKELEQLKTQLETTNRLNSQLFPQTEKINKKISIKAEGIGNNAYEARTAALIIAKSKILEIISGTYISSDIQIKNGIIAKEEIKSLRMGIINDSKLKVKNETIVALSDNKVLAKIELEYIP